MLLKIVEYSFLIRIFNNLLSDIDKINVIKCSKFLYDNKHKMRFNNIYKCYKKNTKLWYYNCLTKIKVLTLFKYPENVTHVYLGDGTFNSQPNLPQSTIFLQTGKYFNCSLSNLPISLKTLLISSIAIKILSSDNLPKGIKVLILKNVNLTISSLPNSIDKLIIDHGICKIENDALKNIESLIIDDCSILDVEDFGLKLKELILEGHCNNDLAFKLPETLETLVLGRFFTNGASKNLNGVIPNSVKLLKIKNCNEVRFYGAIPHSVKELHLLSRSFVQFNEEILIPHSVETLYLNICRAVAPRVIPDSVTKLIFNPYSLYCLKGVIPNSVVHLEFGENFNCDVIGHLPSNLKHLKLTKHFNKSLVSALPEGLTHLILSNVPKESLKRILPSSIKYLSFSGEIGENFLENIPVSLKHLTL